MNGKHILKLDLRKNIKVQFNLFANNLNVNLRVFLETI